MSGFGEPWNGTRMCGPGEGRGQSRAMEGHEQKPMLSKSGFFSLSCRDKAVSSLPLDLFSLISFLTSLRRRLKDIGCGRGALGAAA